MALVLEWDDYKCPRCRANVRVTRYLSCSPGTILNFNIGLGESELVAHCSCGVRFQTGSAKRVFMHRIPNYRENFRPVDRLRMWLHDYRLRRAEGS